MSGSPFSTNHTCREVSHFIIFYTKWGNIWLKQRLNQLITELFPYWVDHLWQPRGHKSLLIIHNSMTFLPRVHRAQVIVLQFQPSNLDCKELNASEEISPLILKGNGGRDNPGLCVAPQGDCFTASSISTCIMKHNTVMKEESSCSFLFFLSVQDESSRWVLVKGQSTWC